MLKIVRFLVVFAICAYTNVQAQGIRWAGDGVSYYEIKQGEIQKVTLPKSERSVFLSRELLTPIAATSPLNIRDFTVSEDGKKVLIYTNSKRVWRYDTRGDYYVVDLNTQSITQIGKSQPSSSLMFAKLSPDGKQVAYVSKHNLYVENSDGTSLRALTTDGTDRLINGTFDWVYEEEFNCRDGFRWSPDSKRIAYWQLDARKTRNFLMINNTDSLYSFTIPVEYPKVGQDPSSAKIGVVEVSTAKTQWMDIPGDHVQNYLPRMDFVPQSNEMLVQQINREQNKSMLYTVNAQSGQAKLIFTEQEEAWVDAYNDWHFLNKNSEVTLLSEKDGWQHLYRIALDGKKETLITKGNYDVMDIKLLDEKNNVVYFMASPDNPQQKYLYKTKLDGKGKLERVTPSIFPGTHNYSISTNSMYARHSYSSSTIKPVVEWMNLSTGTPLTMEGSLTSQLAKQTAPKNPVEFIKVTTEDGVELNGWMKKPNNFNPNKKYPVLFFVYGEPATATTLDTYGAGSNFLYQGDMAEDGYIYISIDNRGTPLPKGRTWRKSIYKNIGVLNIRDQAMAAKKLLATHKYMDETRVAVWGWSGGGSSTLNLMFQYPEIYKAGISIAAVVNQLTYDNIYQERYMGSPLKSTENYLKGSPVTYAKNLQGHLLYIHGTADDNVHYQNAELLINELIKHQKPFQLMSYPNRDHSINSGAGTRGHLSLTFTQFLKTYCPPGAR